MKVKNKYVLEIVEYEDMSVKARATQNGGSPDREGMVNDMVENNSMAAVMFVTLWQKLQEIQKTSIRCAEILKEVDGDMEAATLQVIKEFGGGCDGCSR